MNKIETKRKELESANKIRLIRAMKGELKACDKNLPYHQYLITFGKLEGFNLGVEMAQKEFLDKIKKFNNPIYEDSSLVGDIVDIRLFKEDWEELKQSLNSPQIGSSTTHENHCINGADTPKGEEEK